MFFTFALIAKADDAAAPPAQAPAPVVAPVERHAPAPPEMPEGVQDTITLASQLVRMVAFLGGICALGWLAVKVLGPRLSPMNGRPGDLIKVIDMKRLDPKTTLYVIEVGGKYSLVAVSENEVRNLSHIELDDDAIRELAAKRDNSNTQKVTFGQVLARSAASKESGE